MNCNGFMKCVLNPDTAINNTIILQNNPTTTGSHGSLQRKSGS